MDSVTHHDSWLQRIGLANWEVFNQWIMTLVFLVLPYFEGKYQPLLKITSNEITHDLPQRQLYRDAPISRSTSKLLVCTKIGQGDTHGKSSLNVVRVINEAKSKIDPSTNLAIPRYALDCA